jgi:transcriptional regulator with XRE-family HTH domain
VSYVKEVRVMSSKSLSAKEFGERLKAVREERQWTQAEFAARIQRDQSEVSRWERGRVMPEYDTLTILARGLGVEMSALMETENGTPRSDVADVVDRLTILDRESRAADSRARAAALAEEASVLRGRAAVIEAEAAVERAVAARLAEENARDLRQGVLSSEETARKVRQGVKTLAVARGKKPAPDSTVSPEAPPENHSEVERE